MNYIRSLSKFTTHELFRFLSHNSILKVITNIILYHILKFEYHLFLCGCSAGIFIQNFFYLKLSSHNKVQILGVVFHEILVILKKFKVNFHFEELGWELQSFSRKSLKDLHLQKQGHLGIDRFFSHDLSKVFYGFVILVTGTLLVSIFLVTLFLKSFCKTRDFRAVSIGQKWEAWSLNSSARLPLSVNDNKVGIPFNLQTSTSNHSRMEDY